ncbi:MAG: type IV secretory system conjugative DNA transfer family protein [Bacilli bacterium]
MKFKFRADSKDFIIFGIFAVFLLYLVAIGVVNLHTFSNYGYFSGLNPFKAFTSQFLLTTVVFYILALVASFMSVSSKFFDMDKGFGATTKKKDSAGYSRWMDEKEMKQEKEINRIRLIDDTYPYGGVPIINDGKYAWVDDGENHSLIIGASGSGKTQCIMFPYVKILAKKGESMIITDPKGEIYEDTAQMLKEKGYKVILINFRDPKNGSAWNPFSLPYRLYKEGNTDKATELLEDLANNILHDSKTQDAFWEKSAGDYFTALSLGLFEDAEEDQVNLNSINMMATIGEERLGNSNFIKEYFQTKGELSSAYVSASNTINAPAETKGGILSVFRQKIRIFSSREILSEMLSHSDFDLRDIGKEKTAVFLKIHDEKTTYHALATIFIKQVYECLIDVAHDQDDLKLKYRTNFVLDEFANMPALKDVESMITASRSRNIRFTFVIQNFSQLTKEYGKDIAETIKGNCGNLIFLITTELAALEEISKLCGDVKPKEKKDKPSEPIRPLVTVSDLQQMKKFEVLIKRFRNQPFKTKFTPNFKIDYGKKYEKAKYPTRETSNPKVFDLKKFVLDKKKESGQDAFNPFAPNMNNMPFPKFAGMPPIGSQVQGKPSSPNVDEWVKKIDEKIAELEKEEELEKLKAKEMAVKKEEIKEEQKTIVNPLAQKIDEKVREINNKDEEKEKENIKEMKEIKEEKEETKEIISKPKINVDVDSIVVKDKITDDQFFDDFFGDE